MLVFKCSFKKPFYHSYFSKKEKIHYVPVQVLIPNCYRLKSVPELLMNCQLCEWDAQKVQKQLLSTLVWLYSLQEQREQPLEIFKLFFFSLRSPWSFQQVFFFWQTFRELKKLTQKYMTTISEGLFNVFLRLWMSFRPKCSQLNCCTTQLLYEEISITSCYNCWWSDLFL